MSSTPPIAPIAVSLGDPAGVGPEVIAKCWDSRGRFDLPPFVAIGDRRSVESVWDGPIAAIEDPREADSAFDVGLPLIHIRAGEAVLPGHPTTPAPIARSIRSSSPSVSPAPARPARSSPARSPRSNCTASASPIPARPSSSPSAAACRTPMSR